MARSRLISVDDLLGLCDVMGRRRKWSAPPNPRVIIACRHEADDVLDGFPTPIEEVAAILFAFSRNEFRLEDAKHALPVGAAVNQAKQLDIRVTEAQIALLKDLQDDIADDLTWEETVARCEQILRPVRR